MKKRDVKDELVIPVILSPTGLARSLMWPLKVLMPKVLAKKNRTSGSVF